MRAVPALLLLAACGGADQTGVSALLRISGGQFVRGPLPGASGGPAVLSASINRSDIAPGLVDRSVDVVTEPGTSGVLLGIAGDTGYWVLPAGPPDVQQSNQLKNSVPVGFSPLLPSGRFQLVVQAVSSAGSAGVPVVIPLHTQDQAADPGALAFALSWDTEADLDLHVVDPAGNEIFWRNIAADGGLLDFDSNQSCILDGRRREVVSWSAAPPRGTYRVLVDTPSLCAAATAHWKLQATLGPAAVAAVEGQSIPSDTRGFHARGAGLLVLELVVP